MADNIQEPPTKKPVQAAGPGDDVLALAAKGQGGMQPGQQGGQDPVMLAKEVIGKLLMLMQLMPQIAPLVQEFLQKLSAAGGNQGQPPTKGPMPPGAGAPPPGSPPPDTMMGGPPPEGQ